MNSGILDVTPGKVKVCRAGCNVLKIFVALTSLSILYGAFLIYLLVNDIPASGAKVLLVSFLIPLVISDFVLFWVGIVMVYITSMQLGIKWRVLGIVCGWIPILNIVMLCIIIGITGSETKFELEKIRLNQKRKEEKVCGTKYPVLLVHGVFFRDFEHLNYWGRIPAELERNGAVIYYGNHNSASSVADSAKELSRRIRSICEETGCEKLNIIAHSKGGLDVRYALSNEGMAPFVASLTTINTPHRGCEFADYLLHKIPEKEKNMVAKAYNAAASKLGDKDPDFLAAVYDLTHENAMKINEEAPDVQGVFYRSVGSKLNRPSGGKFPLNLSYHLVKHFDGANDGLVGEESFKWGEDYRFLTVKGKRGISHGDMIDLNRENIKDFDVREFYVKIVSELKEMGL